MQIPQIQMTALFSEGVKVEKAASVLNVEAAGSTGSSFMEMVNALLKGVEMEGQNEAMGQEPVPTRSFGEAETTDGGLNGAEIMTAAPVAEMAAPENPGVAVKDVNGLLNIIDESGEEDSKTIAAGMAKEAEAVQDTELSADTGSVPVMDEVLDIHSEDELGRILLFGELLPVGDEANGNGPEKNVSTAPVPEMQDAYEILNDITEDGESPEKEIIESDMAPIGDDYYSHEVLATLSVLKQAFLKSAVPFEKAASAVREYYKNAPVENGNALESGASAGELAGDEVSFDHETEINTESDIEFGTPQEDVFSASDETVESTRATVAPLEINNAITAPLANTSEAVEPAPDPMDLKTAAPFVAAKDNTATFEPYVSIKEIPATEIQGTEAVKAEAPEVESFKKEISEAFPKEHKEANPTSAEKVTIEETNAEAGKEPKPATAKTEHAAEPRHGVHRDINTVAAERKAPSVFNSMPEQAENSVEKAATLTDAKTVHTADVQVKSAFKQYEVPVSVERHETDANGKAMEINVVSKNEGSAGFEAEGGDYEAAQGFGESVEVEGLNAAMPNAPEKPSFDAAVKEAKAVPNQAPVVNKDVFEKLGESIRLSIKENGGEVRMTLKPESLGELRIKMNVENSAVRAEIIVDNHAVKAVLETDSTALRDAFAQQGLTLDKYTIEVSGASNSASTTEERGSAPERHRESFRDGFREFGGGRDRDGASERQNPRRNPFERGLNNERSVDFFA